MVVGGTNLFSHARRRCDVPSDDVARGGGRVTRYAYVCVNVLVDKEETVRMLGREGELVREFQFGVADPKSTLTARRGLFKLFRAVRLGLYRHRNSIFWNRGGISWPRAKPWQSLGVGGGGYRRGEWGSECVGNGQKKTDLGRKMFLEELKGRT